MDNKEDVRTVHASMKATGNFEMEGMHNPQLPTTRAQSPNRFFPQSQYLHVVKDGEVQVFHHPKRGGMVKAKLERGAWAHTYACVEGVRVPVHKHGDVWVLSGRD